MSLDDLRDALITSTPPTSEETIKRLAALPTLDYLRAKKESASALGITEAGLDKLINETRKATAKPTSTDNDMFPMPEPWPSPVQAEALLNQLTATIKRFMVCPDETADAAALWVVMTWFIDVIQVAPLAVITAPEKRCGKSQLLFILGRLVNRPLTASNITPAALFRSIELWSPTLLIDEADAFMKDNEGLRGLINAGHARDSAYIIRCVGDDHEPKRFNVWGAKALSGIGHLPETIMDRAIVLELRRKTDSEKVERLRHAEPDLFSKLVSQLARFADDNRTAIRQARPELPNALNDRAQDNWESLLAIAQLAGPAWFGRATAAALKLSGSNEESLSIGVELLADIKEVFELKRCDKITTADLITELCGDDEKSWNTYNRGKPVSPRQIANRLRDYGITSKNIRTSCAAVAKGFELEQFTDAFNRYIPILSATTLQNNKINDLDDSLSATHPLHSNLSATTLQNGSVGNVADNANVADCSGTVADTKTHNPLKIKECSGVADRMEKTAHHDRGLI